MVCCLTLCVVPRFRHSHWHTESSIRTRSISPRSQVSSRRQSTAEHCSDRGQIPGPLAGSLPGLSLSRLWCRSRDSTSRVSAPTHAPDNGILWQLLPLPGSRKPGMVDAASMRITHQNRIFSAKNEPNEPHSAHIVLTGDRTEHHQIECCVLGRTCQFANSNRLLEG